ncbi:helix-turn-helix domain-containing protein [Aggregatimonas sangjinii]|uniref:Helix-turn-helix domain-containing protein n=1 Tax=Aggregatimonas sangjinii TaxID=2583587 RepID=A0A5B7SLJ0_9FLAO|nr:helix-turn-helix domain-containing protein [Aggregatimonas sangjinii]QCW99425.1 helix-turn-helix domain-containing protein [Aggregatimonas sangjinii]
MNHFSTLEAYCKGIGISKPRWPEFDIRSFEENMKTVHHNMPPFKHEFYAIAVKLDGGGFAKTGNYSTADKKATVFFNSPYQIIQWDIAPDWEGFYVIFSENFYRGALSRKRITEDFPFLLIDNTIPLDMDADTALLFSKVFADIFKEHRTNSAKAEDIIRHYLHILLHKVSRLYDYSIKSKTITTTQRTQDLTTVSRFKTMLDIAFHPGQTYNDALPNQVQFYADKLNMHPNHFNAVVKRITDSSASEIIYGHILSLSKSKLTNTTKSIKEIAFDLYYNYPNHFANFFKKQMGMTPSQFRKQR